MDVYIANLEQGMPTVEQARIRLEQAFRTARAQRCKALKLIHGYGSSGKGGAIRREIQNILSAQKRAGKVKLFAPGEDFSPFYSDARLIIEKCPVLAKDRDYAASNHGITIVLL